MTKAELKTFIALWEAAAEDLIETGGCNRSVGIDHCSQEDAVENGFRILEAYLNKLESKFSSSLPVRRFELLQSEYDNIANLIDEVRKALHPRLGK